MNFIFVFLIFGVLIVVDVKSDNFVWFNLLLLYVNGVVVLLIFWILFLFVICIIKFLVCFIFNVVFFFLFFVCWIVIVIIGGWLLIILKKLNGVVFIDVFWFNVVIKVIGCGIIELINNL